jgi:hypothetical protein
MRRINPPCKAYLPNKMARQVCDVFHFFVANMKYPLGYYFPLITRAQKDLELVITR